jgi:hypothetical protein
MRPRNLEIEKMIYLWSGISEPDKIIMTIAVELYCAMKRLSGFKFGIWVLLGIIIFLISVAVLANIIHNTIIALFIGIAIGSLAVLILFYIMFKILKL